MARGGGLRRTAVALVFTIASLALVEGLLHAAGYHGINPPTNIAYDAELGWALRPNQRDFQSALDYGVWVATDTDGLRIVEGRGKPPAATAPALLVVGDSFAYGHGVRADEMFASVLQDALAGTSTPFRVRTSGVPGYATDQEYLQWRRLGPIVRPQQVVLLFQQSDFEDNRRDSVVMGPARYFKPRFDLDGHALTLSGVPVPGKRWITPPGAAERLKDAVRPFAAYALVQTGIRSIGYHTVNPNAENNPQDDRKEDIITAAILGTLQREVRAAGAELTLVLVPDDQALSDRVRAICARLGMRFLDLRPSFAGVSGLTLTHDLHWNAKGHALAARV